MNTFFSNERNIILFSLVITIFIFGGLLEGYFFLEQVELNSKNWIGMIFIRFAFHGLGILPLWFLVGYLLKSIWKPILFGLINLSLLNVYPIMDLASGPLTINNPRPVKFVKQEYNNLASDYDFTTYDVPVIRLGNEKEYIFITEERWNKILSKCNGRIPKQFIGLKNLELDLVGDCPN